MAADFSSASIQPFAATLAALSPRSHDSMKTLFAALAVSLAVALPAAAAETDVKPFHAEYATLRNGDDIGRTTLDLRADGDGTWTLRSETRGTSGLAKLAGIHIVETSRFRWKNGKPEALTYDYKQEGAFKQRTRHADFDWNASTVRVSEGGKDYTYATTPGLIDRQSVTLGLAADLIRGATAFDYKVAVMDRIEDMRYARGANESLNVPAGRYDTVLMQRESSGKDNRRRVARSWFAQSLGWLPVQIEQVDGKGETVTLKLLSAPTR